MQLEVGKIYEGKVTGITKFGAFVELDKDTTGMVHISEVANTFVSEIKDHLQEGQTVKVKVLTIGDDKKISLSIKKALPPPPRTARPNGGFNNNQRSGGPSRFNGGQGRNNNGGQNQGFNRGPSQGGFNKGPRKPFDRDARPPQDFTKSAPPVFDSRNNSGNSDFEDMLSKFKSTSEERFSDLKHVIDNKRKSSSRRK